MEVQGNSQKSRLGETHLPGGQVTAINYNQRNVSWSGHICSSCTPQKTGQMSVIKVIIVVSLETRGQAPYHHNYHLSNFHIFGPLK